MILELELQVEAPSPHIAYGVAPSVCLFENPYRLVSLWDMLPFLAHDFCRSSGCIGQLYAQVSSGVAPAGTTWNAIASELGQLERTCEALGLSSTLAQLRRVKPVYTGVVPYNRSVDEFARDIMEVQLRLIDDLQARMVFIVQAERVIYYGSSTGENLFGLAVDTAFPSATYDIGEAGKCYSLQRSTACVFHLMRVLEKGLSVFAAKFSIPADHTNWQNIIERVEKAIRGMGTDPAKALDWKDQQEWFSQAASHFMLFKDAWRNYTAHARGKYTEGEALVIFGSVCAFMQKLATRLHE